MRIKKIEYENFRNFREHGEIRCATDGRVTIIYGKNGDGKTTLHQLFKWVFYGKVQFNKTTSDRLYNLQLESECEYGGTFEVFGRIDFDHDGELYSITRSRMYKKGLDDSSLIREDVELLKMSDDHDWRRLEKPQEIIETLLPSGLSEYFFFDGESMIADLRLKGKDSASKLRKALYSMFDLDIIESAITHIGNIKLKTTVLGRLYLSKGPDVGGGEISAIKAGIENAQNHISEIESKISAYNYEKQQKKEQIQSISEEIGNTKSKSGYETQRKALKKQRDVFLNNARSLQTAYGDAVIEMFPRLLISKTIFDAKEKINLKIDKNHLPTGINKRLIAYLLKSSTNACICGVPLCEASRDRIKGYLELMPPKSYTSMYNDFTRMAETWGKDYELEKIESYISGVLENKELAINCDQQIHDLDEEEKRSKDVEDLIVARQKAEDRVSDLDSSITEAEKEKNKFEIYLKKQMDNYDKTTLKTKENEKAARRIDIMDHVLNYFTEMLEEKSAEYSKCLENNIQTLLDSMLTSKRRVKVSKDFAVKVTDSFDDESKSEGQFAVVSFAYIGGILKMLQNDEHLSCKEYPLVLDGPFSKLDSDQRQNVVDMIPAFAPQVILFSKDDLQDIFGSERIGTVWTIFSNDEKNVAEVEEGYKWK